MGVAVTITWTQTGGDLMFDQKKTKMTAEREGVVVKAAQEEAGICILNRN